MNLDDYEFQKPGRIVEYFPETQTATVKICNDRTYSTSKSINNQMAQALLYDVPVFTAGGGGWHMTFPIKPNDTCLLSFSESGYDHWFVNNKDAAGVRSDRNPQHWTERRLSLEDGFAQVGWNNLKTSVDSYHASNSQWRNNVADQVISLNEDTSITITSPISLTVNAPNVTVIGETIDLNTSTKVTITSPLMELTGDMVIGGTLDVTGDITGGAAAIFTGALSAASGVISGAIGALSGTFGGKLFNTHTHDESGGETTTTPN